MVKDFWPQACTSHKTATIPTCVMGGRGDAAIEIAGTNNFAMGSAKGSRDTLNRYREKVMSSFFDQSCQKLVRLKNP